MNTKHTAGPWTATTQEKWPFNTDIGSDTEFITSIGMAHYSTSDNSIEDVMKRNPEANGRRIADCKLIAAAPQLLEMLKHAVELLTDFGHGKHHDVEIYRQTIKDATE